MNTFVRFVVILVVAGVVINLAIVLAGNRMGARRQQELEAAEFGRMERQYALLAQTAGDVRAHMLVESQEINDTGVVSTKVLLREYQYNRGSDGKYPLDSSGRVIAQPLPIRRVVIPGANLQVDAMAVAFKDDLPQEYKFLQGKKICLLADIRKADDQNEKTWVRLFGAAQVPPTVAEGLGRPSRIEGRLWQYIDDAMTAKREGNKDALERHPGVEQTTPKPAVHALAQGILYMVAVDENGVTILPTPDSGVAQSMRTEANPTTAPEANPGRTPPPPR